jgi:hypothetical protein
LTLPRKFYFQTPSKNGGITAEHHDGLLLTCLPSAAIGIGLLAALNGTGSMQYPDIQPGAHFRSDQIGSFTDRQR